MSKTSLKNIDRAITQFTTNRDKLRDAGHVIAMMIFYHAAPEAVSDDCGGSGDCTRAAVLVNALPKGWADLMKKWFREFTPIRVSSSGDNAGYDPKYSRLSPEDKLLWWKLEDANVQPFYTLDPSNREGNGQTKALEIADLLKMAKQLGARINKIVDGENDKNIIKPEDAATAKAFATMLTNITFERIEAGTAVNDQTAATPEGETSADEKVAA